MKRLAIVSSYNEECGAAFYSSRLKKHMEAAGYAVDVKRLPVSLLRIARPPAIRRKGDQEIDRIAREVADYDAVLLQLEPGLYGATAQSAYRRIRHILQNAKQVIVTIHGFHRQVTPSSYLRGTYYFARLKFVAGMGEFNSRNSTVAAARFWQYVQSAKHVKVLTFCKADQTILERFFDLPRIDNYPIAYFDQGEVAEIKAAVDREAFLRRYGLDPNRKYFAVSGFLSPYKGHLTAMKALEYLPEDWTLAIVGGEHPHAIEADRDIGRYVRQLLAFATEPDIAADPVRRTGRSGVLGQLFGDTQQIDMRRELFQITDFKYFFPKTDISKRVRFLGQVSDEDMPKFYAALDYFVHPYIKTKSGQSGSGPATMALEFGTNALFSNVPVFREMDRYFTGAMSFFNVGNFVELAESLQRYGNQAAEFDTQRQAAIRRYNPAGMVEAYRRLLES